MKKIYLFLTAMVLSISAFAQTSLRDLYGDWTFTFLDNNDGGKQVTMVLNFTYENNAGEYVFILPEGKGLINVFNGSVSNGIVSFQFCPWGYSYITVDGYKTDNTYIYALYNGDSTSTQRAFLDYNLETKEISNLKFNYGSLGQRDTSSITFTGDYIGAESGSFNLTLVGMQYGIAEPEDTNSLTVSLPTVMAYPTSLTEADAFAMVEVESEGFDEYQVWYNLKLENTVIVEDTQVNEDDGLYLIYVEGLSFEMNYTLNVWATSGDYTSPVVSENIWTGYAPDIRITAKAENVTNTTADITVTTNYWDIEYGPVMFTISAVSDNGPELEPIEIEDKGTGTFHLTGLTGNTEYTYVIGYSAYDELSGSYEKANTATVNFTTLAPTIELEGISYTPIAQGATFVVNSVVSEGLAEDQNVDVYFQLQDSDEAPALATVEDGKYTYTFSNLDSEADYTAVIFAGVGTYGQTGFVKGTEYTEEFTTGAASPEIVISFPEGSYSSSIQSNYYAQITAIPTIVAENAPEYDVYYNLYMGATKYRNEVKVEPTDGQYVINIQELNFSREYKVEAYAVVGDGAYTSNVATFEIMTVGEPGVDITRAEAQNITETSVTIVVEYEPVSLEGDVSYRVNVSADNAPEVEPVLTSEKRATFALTDLTPGYLYTFNVSVTATANGRSYMKNAIVTVETLEPSQVITLDEISYSQIKEGAAFIVGKLDAEGFAEDTHFDVYFQLKGSDAAPQKAVYVINGEESYYEFVFSGLTPNSPYTAVIFGGAGEYGTEGFFQGTVYEKNFVSGATSGVDTIETEEDARYFNLQGVEIAKPAAGTICIKVEGNKATKVIVK